MLVIRLLRRGKKNQPTYKIVVTDKKNPPRGGRFVEEVGFYNPKTKERVLKKERIQYWISQGVKPSDTIYNMLVSEGIIEGGKRDVHKKSKKEAPAESAEKPAEKVKSEAAPEQPAEPAPKEEAPEVKPEEKPAAEAEEKKEEAPAEQKPEEAPKEEQR